MAESFYLDFWRPFNEMYGEAYHRYVRSAIISGMYNVQAYMVDARTKPVLKDARNLGSTAVRSLASYPKVRLTIDNQPFSPELAQPPYIWNLDTTELSEGSHVLGASWSWDDTGVVTVVSVGVVVDNDGLAAAGAQDVWVAPAKYDLVFGRILSDQPVKVRYSGSPDSIRVASPLASRQAAAFADLLPHSELWVESIGVTVNTFFRTYTETRKGHVGVWPRQQYFASDKRRLNVPLLDGPRGVATLGHVVAAYYRESPPGWYLLSMNGRLMQMDLSGLVRTLAGWRVRNDSLLPYWGEETADKSWYLSRHENVGKWLDGPPAFLEPWDIALDHDDEHRILVTDSFNHCVRVVDHRPAMMSGDDRDTEISVFAGSASSQAGYVDGPASVARFDTPWGIVAMPDGSYLVTDRGNAAVRRIKADGMVETVFKSPVNPAEAEFTENGVRLKPSQIRQKFCRQGTFDEATLIRPESVRMTSKGTLVIAENSTFRMVEMDLATKTIREIASIYKSDIVAMRNPVIEVDRYGAMGPVDDIFVVAYAQESQYRYGLDGTFRGPIRKTNSATGDFLARGTLDMVRPVGYPSCIAISEYGRMIYAGFGNHVCYEITRRQPTDPAINVTLYRQGERIFKLGGTPTGPKRPSFALSHGSGGWGLFGQPSISSYMAMDDGSLANFIRSGFGTDVARSEIVGQDMTALIYYLRWNWQTAEAEIPPPDMPAPKDVIVTLEGEREVDKSTVPNFDQLTHYRFSIAGPDTRSAILPKGPLPVSWTFTAVDAGYYNKARVELSNSDGSILGPGADSPGFDVETE